jgi:PadR family transcriptional regulator PadR
MPYNPLPCKTEYEVKQMTQQDWQSEMRKGIAEMYVLSALSGDDLYGYRVTQILEKFQTLVMKESTLYLILARLERDRLVTVRKVASDKGPKRKYFALSPTGRERLMNMTLFWRAFSQDVTEFLNRETSE